MPYKNIHFVKLEKRLLNDHRWYMMSENSQLIYIKLMLLAAQSYNRIPKKTAILRLALRTTLSETEIESVISEIRSNFPKFKQNKHVYYFLGFEEKTNYIGNREFLRKSQGLPKDVVYIEKEEEEEKEEEKDKEKNIAVQSPAKKFKKAKTDPNLSIVIKHVCDKWKAKRGNKYFFTGKHAKLLRGLCRVYSHEDIMALWDLYLLQSEDFYIKCGYSIECFATSMPKLLDLPYKAIAKKFEKALYPDISLGENITKSLNSTVKEIPR